MTEEHTARRIMRDNGLGLFFLGLFFLALIGQSIAGWFRNNEELSQHRQPAEGFWSFVFSSDFLVDVAENWQSEFLQFFLFIAATIWLIQRGSPESKKPGDEGPGSDEDQLVGAHARPDSPAWARAGGWRSAVYGNSLLIVMGLIFLLSWVTQSIAGLAVANEENAMHGEPAISWGAYVVGPDFWDRTLQNWQSEFLAVAAMVLLSIFLRQRGSAESKPVGAPHGVSSWESE
jgi:membrane protein implicated in regulation of membrane protease activity